MSTILIRKSMESTYNSTPAARVPRVQAGIAILQPPAVGEEVRWIALSVVRYGCLIPYEENLLVIDWPDHDTKDNECILNEVRFVPLILKRAKLGRSPEQVPRHNTRWN